jgi:alpha-ketoglutarate-dependent taurine dioxygenase
MEKSMCDYSLHGVANRPAKVGDKLVSTNFVNSFTRGFTEISEPKVAVCLMPGTELAFEQEVEVDHIFRRLLPRFGFGKTGQRVARFRQVNMDRPDTHHDALEFPNGKIVLVTRLCPGQKASVLQLPATAKDPHVHTEHDTSAETPTGVSQSV